MVNYLVWILKTTTVIFALIGGVATYITVNKPLHDPFKYPIQEAKWDMSVIETALLSYKIDHGSYPTDEQGLKILTSSKVKKYLGGKLILRDPWGKEYRYIENKQSPIIWSQGSIEKYGVNFALVIGDTYRKYESVKKETYMDK